MYLKYPNLLICGLLLFCFGFCCFVFTNWDLNLSQVFILSPSDSILHVVKIISNVGSFLIITLLTMLVSVYLWIKRRLYDALFVISTMAGCRVFFAFLKIVVGRHRPVFPEPLTHALTASFPSGHAVNSLTFLLVCYFIFKCQTWFLYISVVLVLTIGWTRLALGAHWTSDVLAGWGGAMMWVAMAMQLKENQRLQNFIYRSFLNKLQ